MSESSSHNNNLIVDHFDECGDEKTRSVMQKNTTGTANTAIEVSNCAEQAKIFKPYGEP